MSFKEPRLDSMWFILKDLLILIIVYSLNIKTVLIKEKDIYFSLPISRKVLYNVWTEIDHRLHACSTPRGHQIEMY